MQAAETLAHKHDLIEQLLTSVRGMRGDMQRSDGADQPNELERERLTRAALELAGLSRAEVERLSPAELQLLSQIDEPWERRVQAAETLAHKHDLIDQLLTDARGVSSGRADDAVVLAPESPLLPWWMNERVMRACVSSDGQVYLRDPSSGREYCLEPSTTSSVYQQLKPDTQESDDRVPGEIRLGPDGDMAVTVVRHLDWHHWRCRDCGTAADQVHFAWSDRRCPQCWSLNVEVLSARVVPPRPAQFDRLGEPPVDWHNAGLQIGPHTWGVSSYDDAMMLWQLSSAYRFAEHGHAPLYVLGLLAESLLEIAYEDDSGRFNLVLNVGNVLDRYFRSTGSAEAAKRMLDTFQRAADLADDPVPRSLARHSFAIGAIYVLDFYEESEAELLTERPGLRRFTLDYLREAIELAGSVRDRDPDGTDKQLGRIRYALADLLRRGQPTEEEIDEALRIFADLDPSSDEALGPFITAAGLETQLSRPLPTTTDEGTDDDARAEDDLTPWIDAANQLTELIWGYDARKFEHRWHWALSLGRFMLRVGAADQARPILQSAVTFARKDTPFDSDPVALTGDAERLFQAFNLLATYYIMIGWAFEGLALLETYRGRVLDIAALDDAGRARRRAAADEAREKEFFGGMFGSGESSTLRLTEEKLVEERTGRPFGPFRGDYELPGLRERIDDLFDALADEPTALLSLSMDTASRESGGAWVSAVVIRPPDTGDPRMRFHTWQLDDQQLETLRSQRHQRPGSFREARLTELCRASHAALLAPIADQLDGAGCTRLMVVLPSQWSALPLEAAVPAEPAPGDPIRRVGLLPALSFGEGPSQRARRPGKERLLIVGYRGSDLEDAETEAATLVELFGPTAAYLHGASLTKRTIIEHLNDEFDFIHLICHGTYDSAHPMESSLYFDNMPGNDSLRLRARELELLTRMPRQPVVTLSACSTALTAQSRSNTWNGLPGSLLRSGAHAIIASRWPVHDQAAALMMNTFYQQIRETDRSLLHCFHRAQAALRDSGARTEDWASFGYLGRP